MPNGTRISLVHQALGEVRSILGCRLLVVSPDNLLSFSPYGSISADSADVSLISRVLVLVVFPSFPLFLSPSPILSLMSTVEPPPVRAFTGPRMLLYTRGHTSVP